MQAIETNLLYRNNFHLRLQPTSPMQAIETPNIFIDVVLTFSCNQPRQCRRFDLKMEIKKPLKMIYLRGLFLVKKKSSYVAKRMMMEMEYEWDEAKRQSNLRKHRLDFVDVIHFNWDSAQVVEDNRESYGEQRFNACGFLFDRLVILTFSVRNERLRIISLRKATQHEQKYYAN